MAGPKIQSEEMPTGRKTNLFALPSLQEHEKQCDMTVKLMKLYGKLQNDYNYSSFSVFYNNVFNLVRRKYFTNEFGKCI